MGNSLDRERYKVAIPQLEKRLTITEQSQKDILEKITVDTALSETSVNPVQNRAIYEALDNIEVDTLANSDIQEIIDSVI